MTKPLQERSFREFRKELTNCPVDYEEKSVCEDVGKTTGVSDKIDAQTVNTNARYRSYSGSTCAMIKSYVASP